MHLEAGFKAQTAHDLSVQGGVQSLEDTFPPKKLKSPSSQIGEFLDHQILDLFVKKLMCCSHALALALMLTFILTLTLMRSLLNG
jgi:hypothetical protein